MVKTMLSLLALAVGLYYYSCHALPKVEVSVSARMTRIAEFCSECMRRGFWPVLWATSGHSQTSLFGLFPGWKLLLGVHPRVNYVRETITMPHDGGTIALDWHDVSHTDNSTPIVVMQCGVVGNAANAYVRLLLSDIYHATGWRVVVRSWRGFGDVPLTGKNCRPELWGLSGAEDLLHTVKHIHRKYPKAPLLGVGFSVGGAGWAICGGKYGQELLKCNLKAVVCLSGPNNYELTLSRMQHLKPLPYDWINMGVVWAEMSRYVQKRVWVEVAGENDLAEFYSIMNERTSASAFVNHHCPVSGWLWHKYITIRFTGHTTVEDYTRSNNAAALNGLKNSVVPTMMLFAEDDPIVPPQAQWEYLEAVLVSGNGFTVVCNRGGHAGFFEAHKYFPVIPESWQSKAVTRFLQGVLRTDTDSDTAAALSK